MKPFWGSTLLALCALCPEVSPASTFIGNGGNGSDIERSVTLTELHESFRVIEEEEYEHNELCLCDEDEEFPSCAVLRNLSKKQRTTCQRILWQHHAKLSKMTSSRTTVNFRWDSESLSVQEKDGVRRVDAAANSQTQTIILDESRFLQMDNRKRMVLLVHELFHLIQIDGQWIDDHKPVGGYRTGRALLDTLGEAVFVLAYHHNIQRIYHRYKPISRAYKKFWVSLLSQSVDGGSNDSRRLLHDGAQRGTWFGLRYQPSDWGVIVGGSYWKNGTDNLEAIDVVDSGTRYSLGGAWRVLPFDAPLSRWGQFHAVVSLVASYLKRHVTVSDGTTTIEDQATGYALTPGVSGLFPIAYNLWFEVGYRIDLARYRYARFGYEHEHPQHILDLGGSYAW